MAILWGLLLLLRALRLSLLDSLIGTNLAGKWWELLTVHLGRGYLRRGKVLIGSSTVAGVRWLHHGRAEGLGISVVWCSGLLLTRISVAGSLAHLLRRRLAVEGILRVEGLLLRL